jgi:hypothetical protein
MAGLAEAADADRKWKIESERRALEQREKERRAEVRRKRKVAEERKLWALLMESASWRQSQQIRAYVSAVKERAIQNAGLSEIDQSLDNWIAWALRQADSLDPLALGSYCTREDRWGNPSSYGEEKSKPRAMELIWNRILRRSRYFESKSDWWLDKWK